MKKSDCLCNRVKEILSVVKGDNRINKLSSVEKGVSRKKDFLSAVRGDIRIQGILVMCISVILAMLMWIFNINDTDGSRITGMERPEPGENAETLVINAYDAKTGQNVDVTVEIEARELTNQELDECFKAAYEEVKTSMLAENDSTENIRTNLNLMDNAQNGIITLDWYTSDSKIVDYSGDVLNSGFNTNDEKAVTLTLMMSCQDREEIFTFNLTVKSPECDEYERYKIDVKNAVDTAVMDNPTDGEVVLPEVIGGDNISYMIKDDKTSPFVFIGLGFIICVLLVIREKEKIKEFEKKRRNDLMLDYSEVISKLTLLLGAGMTTRKAWSKIVSDYMKKRDTGTIRMHYAYEEMYETECSIQTGISEIVAYQQFGKRCNTKEYMKLATLLETNIRKGTRELRKLLENEAAEAFETRKSMAKIKGEEASTKLLLPMMLMLIIVMIIVMVPAMMSFKI